MSQLELELPGMPEPLFAATPSKLAAFDACPRRYRFGYVDRPTPPQSLPRVNAVVGAAVHAALRSWWELPQSRRTPAAARQLLDRHWSDVGTAGAADSAEWRARAAGWVDEHVAGLDPADPPLATERQVTVRTATLSVSGRVDRIDDRGEELVVVDYKTGRRPSTEGEAASSPALALYVLGVRRTLRRPCSRVELHHLPTGTVAGFDHTEATLAEHVRRAEATAAAATAATAAVTAGGDTGAAFPVVTGRQCAGCSFRRSCPEGRAAVRDLDAR
ncbi:PD-(D/E)XK nuclease family protein [Modestobacter sp. Leaf380]|uniref:RecB family exonuclease n=1 Tax=Modestobacter sp. Leaf380 TaxID=1736356 RepID=UPI000AE03595|nr:PD-(D/E)XK nuclease family protein [Modestobacter sp. Leaf380]